MTDHSEQRPLSLKKGSTVTLQYYYVFLYFSSWGIFLSRCPVYVRLEFNTGNSDTCVQPECTISCSTQTCHKWILNLLIHW